jgi:CDGSH-type Zn-finger protein
MEALYPLGIPDSPGRISSGFAGDIRGQARHVPTDLTPYPNGPYLLRGDYRLTDPHGREIDPRRKTVALCRCGASRRKPFCDGTHKLIGFRAPGGEAVPVGELAPLREAAS